MKKLLLGISLILFGGIVIGAALIAGGTVAASMNRVGSSTGFDVFDSGVAVGMTVIGALISLVGLAAAFWGLKDGDK